MLQLYNTMSREKELFKPLQNKKVKMFSCGPSIYRRPHVGNYRSFLWEDVLQRYLEYLGYEVHRVINFTDIEDKAMQEAKERRESVSELTGQIANQFFQDARLLRIKLPSFIPRSSTSVEQAVVLIKVLLDKGYAYWHEGDVFFDPLKFKGFGKLFRLDMSRWPKEKRRFRKDTYPGTRWNLGDFVLWHGYKSDDDVYWDTEIGKGRPAWNIQDPAMITQHLGYQVDISCGGIDNLYRHHDYNLAVIEAISGVEFARFWVHGEHLLVDGKKMSKSKGNIIYPDDLIKDGYRPEDVRFYLLYGHHRKRLNLTREKLQESRLKLEALKRDVTLITEENMEWSKSSDMSAGELINSLTVGFEEHMNNDLDIKGAFDAASSTLTEITKIARKGKLSVNDARIARQKLHEMDEVLQVIF